MRLKEAKLRRKRSQQGRRCKKHETKVDDENELLEVDRSLLPQNVRATAADLCAKKWLQPVFGMVDVRSRWPVCEHNIQEVMSAFSSPTQATKDGVIAWLRFVGRSRAAKALQTTWCASRAALASIASKLGASSTVEMPCPSFDEGYDLAVKHVRELLPPCWMAHPGICETLHKDVFADAIATAKKLQTKLVSAVQDEPAKFWVFDCLSSHCRKTIVVWMIGWTQLSTGPRSVFLMMQAQQGGSRAGPFTTRQVEIVESDCKLPVLERSSDVPLPDELHMEFITRKGPRLGLVEPVWVTQFGLAVGLVLEQLPVNSWKCFSAAAVRWDVNGKVCLSELREQQVFLEQRPEARHAVVLEDKFEAMHDDDVLDQDALEALVARRAALRRQSRLPQHAHGDKEENLLKGLQGKTPWKKGAMWKDLVSDESDLSSEPVSEISSDTSDDVRTVVRKKAAAKTRKFAANLAAKMRERKRRVVRAEGGDGAPVPPAAPAPAAPAAVLPPAAAAAVAPPPQQLMEGFVFSQGYTYVQIQDLGIICFNERNINGHCAGHHIPGVSKCHCDRSRFGAEGRGRRAGQGRPLGLLMLWLMKQNEPEHGEHSSRAYKIRLGGAAFHAERAAARVALRALPESAPLFAAERALLDGEDDEEPLIVPG